jgi:putative phosphonate metabolism protein
MRYAVYYAPMPRTPLHRQGSAWLGRDAHTGEVLAQPGIHRLPKLTAEPRRYGFHATLKAPFALREGITPEALMRACAALAADTAGFRVRLKAGLLDGFLALVPDGDPAALQDLAARCVRELDGFRRPPSEDELARRRKAPLNARQDANLLRWGYPYVLDDFRFHITLTKWLEPEDSDRFLSAARTHFAAELLEPVTIDGLTLFQEPVPGAPFLALRHFPFTISAAEAAA